MNSISLDSMQSIVESALLSGKETIQISVDTGYRVLDIEEIRLIMDARIRRAIRAKIKEDIKESQRNEIPALS